MKTKIMIRLVPVMLLLAASQVLYAQYSNKLFDCDSTYDWGWDILLKPDNTYFIIGGAQNPAVGQWGLYNMNISVDGNTLLDKNIVNLESTSTYPGNAGEAKKLKTVVIIYPLTLQWEDPITGSSYSAGGLVKLDAGGNTIFIKTYTDTSVHFAEMYACAILPDGGYIIGGAQGFDTPSYYPAQIIRTDNIGDTLWTRSYKKNTTENATVTTIIPLDHGRILIGAYSQYYVPVTLAYNHDSPWFIMIDSLGNIIRDTIYTDKFMGNGNICKDTLGGYAEVGQIDTLAVASDPNNMANFTNYIAHLDTNFRIQWLTRFPFGPDSIHRYTVKTIQLHDGNFLVAGDAGSYAAPYYPYALAWAAKVSHDGDILWSHFYVSDSTHDAYFRDVIELPGGNLMFAGATFNDSLPSWRQGQDVWLVGTDSNGCEIPGCLSPTQVITPTLPTAAVKIYPNPTSGAITVSCPQAGNMNIYDMQGRLVAGYQLQPGNTPLQLPAAMASGIYMCRYYSSDNSQPPTVVRMVYVP